MNTDLLPTAYHEAGHAVVAWCLGLEVRSINIRPDDAGGSAVIGGSERLAMVDRIAVTVAGAEAEHFFKLRTHELGIYGDMRMLVTLLDEIPEHKAIQLREDGYRRAHDLLMAHEDKVVRLAQRLFEVRFVDAAEFLRLMSP
jgi:ATP-dependent Zn protease